MHLRERHAKHGYGDMDGWINNKLDSVGRKKLTESAGHAPMAEDLPGMHKALGMICSNTCAHTKTQELVRNAAPWQTAYTVHIYEVPSPALQRARKIMYQN